MKAARPGGKRTETEHRERGAVVCSPKARKGRLTGITYMEF